MSGNFFGGEFFGGGFFGALVTSVPGGGNRRKKGRVLRASDLETREWLENKHKLIPPPQEVIVEVEDESEDELVIALLARVLH